MHEYESLDGRTWISGKKKNEKDAISNGILTKSKEKVVQTLTTYLQAIPEIKDNYQLNITIQDAKTDE